MSTVATDHLVVSGRRLRKTPVYDAYWRFAAERQRVFFRRYRGDAVLTTDPIIARHRFTNSYRASDRVSQFLISNVIANANRTAEDVAFRTLLFKVFNKVETWRDLETRVGPLHLKTVEWDRLNFVLARAKELRPIYSGAYIMPSPPFGAISKHTNHLRLIKAVLDNGIARRWERTQSLQEVFRLLLDVPSFGPFLAFQFAIDLNYSPVNPHFEHSHVVAGPGARDGIAKCFVGADDSEAEEIIMAVYESQEAEFAERGIDFPSLWGRRLQPVDCQNLFCEIDKYARVAYPQYAGRSGRTRIKQVYHRSGELNVRYCFPSAWGLDTSRSLDVPPALWF